MASNGITKIIVKGVEYPLYFNIQATEEFTNRIFDNVSSSPFKVMVDMIYSGMVGYAASKNIAYPKFEDVYKICEDFMDEKDSAEQYEEIDRVFVQSKWGSKKIEELEDIKKKIAEMESMIGGTGTTSEDTA